MSVAITLEGVCRRVTRQLSILMFMTVSLVLKMPQSVKFGNKSCYDMFVTGFFYFLLDRQVVITKSSEPMIALH